MAEGGYENPGFGEGDPFLEHTEDRDDDRDDDTTMPFQPNGASTPHTTGVGPPREEIPMQTMQHEKSGLPETSYTTPMVSGVAETSFGGRNSFEDLERRLNDLRDKNTGLLNTTRTELRDLTLSEEDKKKEIKRIEGFIQKRYPKAKLSELSIRYRTKGKKGFMDIVAVGPKGGETKIALDDGSGLQKKFKDTFESALGPTAEKIKAQENATIRESRKRLREAIMEQKQLEKTIFEKEKAEKEMQNLSTKIERTQARIDQLGSNVENESELQRLRQTKKNYQTDFDNAKKEVAALEKQVKNKEKERAKVDKLSASLAAEVEKRNTLEDRLNSTKTLDEINEEEAELKRQNEEDRKIIDDENTSPSERAAAEERVAEREEELARLEAQIEERERAMPLRERVKEIFKKYGVTVTTILLAAGVTIGAVIGAITNSLKALGKGVGNGLKEIGKKTASLLPGLIGQIASFLFKTAGQVISFLAEHTWLLILAAVAFVVERYIKKRR